MDISADTVKKLMDLGFAAVNYGWLQEAETIFNGVEAARGDAPYGPMGMGLVHIAKGEYDEAATVLQEQALGRDPDNVDAKKLLALALKLAGRGSDLDKVGDELRSAGGGEFLDALS